MLSGYESELYERELRGWYQDCIMSHTTSAELAREVIWMNFEPCGQMSLFDEIGGMNDGA